ncbi:response regulator transcription factor [Paenibacillus campi]|uniref:response regulator transcription factor n=1 Tax=Paenibacillus campi TaxID=3106031 RepID=UPI002AFF58AE|nr:response regulator [Paenibacillus sp. SGZ-1014]
MRIVVVEDEPRTRNGIVQLIHKISSTYEVVGEAENGLVGLEMIERLRPDLVFMDIKMPLMTGMEMLERLNEQGITPKTVILTGYSEFEYARKAIQMKVYEYLEKPITAKDLKVILEKVEQELLYDGLLGIRGSDRAEKMQQMLQRFMTSESESDALGLMVSKLQQLIGFDIAPIQVFNVYMGDCREGASAQQRAFLKRTFDRQPDVVYTLCELPAYQEMVAMFQVPDEQHLQGHLSSLADAVNQYDDRTICCYAEINHLDELKVCLAKLRQLRKWSIVLGNQQAMHCQLIEQLQPKPFHYPLHLEQKAKAAIIASNGTEVVQYLDEFVAECQKEIHQPQDLFEAYIHFFAALTHAAKEMHHHEVAIQQHELLLRLLQSQTCFELQDVFEAIKSWILNMHKPHVQSLNLTVNKALHLIHQQYQQGITLDEIAGMLHITPEYLSSLFNKEVKRSFSSYVKELRINKAKELLIVSGLKAYEVANQIGYSDSTYFSRVFKEVTGMSPVEYQKLHR